MTERRFALALAGLLMLSAACGKTAEPGTDRAAPPPMEKPSAAAPPAVAPAETFPGDTSQEIAGDQPAEPAAPLTAGLISGFESTGDWKLGKENGVTASTSLIAGRTGKALEISYDFGSGSWLDLSLSNSANLSGARVFRFFHKGSGAKNAVELKLEDEDGTVFGKRWDDITAASSWSETKIPLDSLTYFWGGDKTLDRTHIIRIHLAVASTGSGKGTVAFDDLSAE